MCGLVGVASVKTLTISQEKVFKNLLVVDVLRGAHSTGVFSVNSKTNEQVLVKRDVDSLMFTTSKLWDKATSVHTANVMIGHNRWATKGKINSDNAHPFQHGPITLVHNGTLHSVVNLEKHTEFDTDSETIAYNLSQVGVDKAGEVISKLNGAFALVWFDSRDKTVNFIRNADRELYLAGNAEQWVDATLLSWASEKDMLPLCFKRNNYTETLNIDLLPEMQHVKVNLSEENLQFAPVQKYKEHVPPTYHTYTNPYHSLPNNPHDATGLKTGDVVEFIITPELVDTQFALKGRVGHKDATQNVTFVASLYIKNKTLESVHSELVANDHYVKIVNQYIINGEINISVDTLTEKELKDFLYPPNEETVEEASEEEFVGPDGVLVGKKAMEDLCHAGCAWCADPIFPNEYETLTWYLHTPVCYNCSEMTDQYLNQF